MSKIDGGPAFPTTIGEVAEQQPGKYIPIDVNYSGLSIRDWFAGQALTGGLLNWKLCDASYKGTDKNNTALAASCYAVADAMLAERAKK